MNALRYLLLIVIAFLLFSCKKAVLFEKIPSSHSGIHFNNEIVENDSINPLDMLNIYNGGGVGIGDFNNDGLQDIYFIGNAVTNRLYLNKGDMEFGAGEWQCWISIMMV